ncbi:MAG: protease modulator HflC [Dehalococcoidia bacterium]|nr:protease modulator HflC [Dehalococcoidia bacterium]
MRIAVIGIFVIGLVAVIGVLQAVYTVDEVNYAVVQQFGQITAVNEIQGIHFKTPFVQQVTYLDRRVLSTDTTEEEYLTSDQKRVVVDHVTRWKIVEPRSFFLKLNTESSGSARLERLVVGALRQNIAARPYNVMISEERDAIMDQVRDEVQKQVNEGGLGVTILDVRTKRVDLPTAVQQSVFARMASDRKVEADRFRATGQQRSDQITSETDRLVTIMGACAARVSKETRGRGEAAAIAIFAQALQQDPDFYSFIRRLEAYDTAFSAKDRVVMSTESNFFRLLSGEVLPLPKVDATRGQIVPLSQEVIKQLTSAEIDALIKECIPESALAVIASPKS